MKKYSFLNDYSEGAHPKIIEALSESNLDQEAGYGDDQYCIQARDAIYKLIGNANADIHFVTNGTQANLIVISSMLKPYESVIAPDTSHISEHEAGAVESTGHKINTISTDDGKLTPELIQPVLDYHNMEHMVKPRMVFISNSTEVGTVYSKKELRVLSDFCKKNNLYLYLDGARLASALTCQSNDLALSELSNLVDVFYVGGTKNGALLGEAIVINNDTMKENFRFHLKQRGALLAKGRVFGKQFLTLFQNDLYFALGEHANVVASLLVEGIKKAGYNFLYEPASNQIFPILPNTLIEKLKKKYEFYVWSKVDDDNSSVRLVTSWATTQEAVEGFVKELT